MPSKHGMLSGRMGMCAAQLHAPVPEEEILAELRSPTSFGSAAAQLLDPVTLC